MTADDFRSVFNRNRNVAIRKPDGSYTLAVGLNGDQMIIHGGDQVPLAKVRANIALQCLDICE